MEFRGVKGGEYRVTCRVTKVVAARGATMDSADEYIF